jgi:hypothetical protein
MRSIPAAGNPMLAIWRCEVNGGWDVRFGSLADMV